MLRPDATALSEAQHPAPVEPYLSARHLAGSVVALLLLHVAYDVYAVIADVEVLGLLSRVRDGAPVPAAEVSGALDQVRSSDMLQTLGVPAVGVAFVTWLRRVYLNLGPLGTRSLRLRPVWAIGAWAVPAFNYYAPKLIVNDVWRASDPDLPAEVERPPAGAPVPFLVNAWWAAWIAGQTTLPRFVPASVDAAGVDAAIRGVQRGLAGGALFAVAGVLAAVSVWRITRRQEERYARLAYGGAPGGVAERSNR